MKKLQCELCGGTDIVKEGEFFVCQNCGVKYTPEDARIMIMGKIEVDQSERLNNLYLLARRAKQNNDIADGNKYYSEITVLSPDDWEASFYSVYYREYNCKIAEMLNAITAVQNCIQSTCELIKKTQKDKHENAYKEMDNAIKIFAQTMVDAAISYLREMRYSNKASSETFDRIFSCCQLLMYTGETIVKEFDDRCEGVAMGEYIFSLTKGMSFPGIRFSKLIDRNFTPRINKLKK